MTDACAAAPWQNEVMGHFLDLDGWKRREHFDYFRRIALPFFSVSVEIEVTMLREACRAGGRSFFLASLFHALYAANQTEEMRMRLRGERVWVHERLRISSTILRPDETFGFIRLDPEDDAGAFEERGRTAMERARGGGPSLSDEGDDDVIYHSTLPWIRFTGFTNALPLGGDSIPRVVFGRCAPDGTRWRMPVAVEVHHALVDGLAVARFLERLEKRVGGG
ncbi:MAG TPA: CatA-like O-acetyltransferase [Thermoanaerobaculia bacterium]|nr:CatA-like O-acetyltransferase [Thermoanaerobaculia bacterium]